MTVSSTERYGAFRINLIHDRVVVTGLRIDDVRHHVGRAGLEICEPDLRLIDAFMGFG